MVCNVCQRDSLVKDQDQDCFIQLLRQLEIHYKDRVKECQSKDEEINKLKEALSRGSSASKPSPPKRVSSDSFDLFVDTSQDSTVSEPFPLGQQDVLGIFQEPKHIEDLETTECLEENIVRNAAEESRDHRMQSKESLEPGWRKKATRLSFTSMHDKTRVYSPKKSGQKSTITDHFKKKPEVPVQVSSKIVKQEPQEVIPIDDEAPEEWKTPKPEKIRSVFSRQAKEDKERKTLGEMDQNLDDFCTDCRKYYELNPPTFLTHKDRLRKIRECEKHRAKKFKGHETPEGFWKATFGPTPPQMKTQVYVKKPRGDTEKH